MGFKDLFKKKDRDGGEAPLDLDTWIGNLASRDAEVRFEACRKLATYGPRALKAAPKLHELIEDDDGDVCNAAAAALSEIERNPS